MQVARDLRITIIRTKQLADNNNSQQARQQIQS
jgi:hypothetical protein